MLQKDTNIKFTVYNLGDLLEGFAWRVGKRPAELNPTFIDNCHNCNYAIVTNTENERSLKFDNGKVWDIVEEQVVIAALVSTDVYYSISSERFSEAITRFSTLVEREEVKGISYWDWRRITNVTKNATGDLHIVEIPNDTMGQFIIYDTAKREWTNVALSNDFQSVLATRSIHPPHYPWKTEKIMEQEEKKFDEAMLAMKKTLTKNENEKENNTMNMPNVNFDFGPCGDAISLSPYGLAIKSRDGKWLTYNPQAGNTVDVTGFTFDFKGMIYKVPVAIADIKAGDMIMHQGKPMFVTAVSGNDVSTIDIIASEAKNIVPVTNPFGFNFVTKITSLMNLGSTAPDPSNPFGNIMPMMIWSEILNGSEENGRRGEGLFGGLDLGKMMMLSALTGQQNPFGNMFNFGNLNPGTANQTQNQ